MKSNAQKLGWAAPIALLASGVLLWAAYCLLPTAYLPSASADAYTSSRKPVFQAIVDAPTIAITTGTATTGATPTTGVTSAQVQWKFGTVAGSFGTCTVQAKTTYDGMNYLTLGSAVSVTATSATLNAWTLLAQGPTTSVTSSAVSSSAALGFGQLTEYVFACSSYGTLAPVAITAIYR